MEGLDLKALIQNIGLIAEEKNISEEAVISIIENAIAVAWRRENGEREWKVRAELNINNGDAKVFRLWDVVEEVEDDASQLTVEDAQKYKKDAKFGDVVEEVHEMTTLGRVAAMTAKQVVVQALREAERAVILEEYRDRIGEILTGVVERVTPRVVMVEIGKATGLMLKPDQVEGERYGLGQRIKVLFKEIEVSEDGRQSMLVSRADANFVRVLFEQEVPEIENGSVEIKAIAREAGKRTKLAVASAIPGVDPVGTFVGGHGSRVNAVMNEIGDEKIDIVSWDSDIKNFIANSISPAEVTKIEINDEERTAKIFVTEDQQSIAIGRGGQNVRLASKITGYDLDIEVAEIKAKKVASSKIAEGELVAMANESDGEEEE